MQEIYKNSKYTIWLYNISSREYTIIKEFLPEEHFDVIDIGNDFSKFNELQDLHILQKPDVVICDVNSVINDNIIGNLYRAHCALAKVSTKPQTSILDNTFELTDEKIESIKNGKSITATKTEKSMHKIIDMCQLAKIIKLQSLTKLGAKNIYESMNISEELDSGKSTASISKQYLFKLAQTLNDFISFKDNYTRGHCERVANYAEALGHAIDMNDEELEDLILAANLHDIGKIALPDAVITKTDKLNDLEFNLMKKHVQLGASLLPGNELGYLKDAVRAHHEKYDGSGYPDGLKGDEIPKLAQILAIADSFDAMTSQRSYNHVKSAKEAFEDLKRHTKPYGVDDGLGVFYNPKLVDVFIEVISNSKTTMANLEEAKRQADLNVDYKSKQDAAQKEHNKQLVLKGDVNNE